ncbi:soma ferritin-like [Asterias amurensis]|uniref:soma ferritin-like n=1 Tax=Asterias amurensis TaxID=7602 RepID=UPI003AB2E33C
MQEVRNNIIRQNYHEESEAAINRHLNLTMYASYTYLSMSAYFGRADIAVPCAQEFFKRAHEEEQAHVWKLIKFQNMRGGLVVLQDVVKPDRDEWGSLLEAIGNSLEIEKKVNQSLLDLHAIADRHGDAQMCEWIGANFLTNQVLTIEELGNHITQLRRVGPGLGEYIYDKESLCNPQCLCDRRQPPKCSCK